jgi:hypothetical protein
LVATGVADAVKSQLTGALDRGRLGGAQDLVEVQVVRRRSNRRRQLRRLTGLRAALRQLLVRARARMQPRRSPWQLGKGFKYG